jgi:hypothetical protein
VVEQDCTRAGGALVNGEDEALHARKPSAAG